MLVLRILSGANGITECLRVRPVPTLNILANAMSTPACGSIDHGQDPGPLFQYQNRMGSPEIGSNLANLIDTAFGPFKSRSCSEMSSTCIV